MSRPMERLLMGRKLAGRYEIEKMIGTGGMSLVFRGRDTTLGRPVAIKVVTMDAPSDEARQDLRERFRREAGSAARIPHHPNVVQIFDYGTDPELDLDFIVMELLEGRDLKEALAREGLPRDRAVRVLRDAARGLAAGHHVGIVHRDVKPANVFLVRSGDGWESARILDFGIAKPVEPGEDADLTRTGQLPHSPAYASPEQVDPERVATPASDVYQLGLIAYEVLAGERPYDRVERARVQSGDSIPLPVRGRWGEVPRHLREVVEQALEPDPANRFPTAAEFADALSSVVAEEGTVLHVAAAAPPPDVTSTIRAEHAAPPVVIPVEMDDEPGTVAVDAEDEPAMVPAEAQAAAGTRKPIPRVFWLVPLLLLGLVALAKGTHRKAAEPVAAAPPAADTLDADSAQLARLDDQFLRLQGSVDTTPPPSGASPGAAVPTTVSGVAAPPSSFDPEREADVVRGVLRDLNESFVAGDLERHMAHYADRVDFYLQNGYAKDAIRRDRAAAMALYDEEKKMTLRHEDVSFPQPGVARVLVDRAWELEGKHARWTGSERQAFVLELRGGSWLIVSENDQKIFRSRKTTF